MSRVVVRFAPSPTGFLHIGGARTAIYNFMFARHYKGSTILRIDDTDLARSEEKYRKEIMESLAWLGLDFQEIYRQSDRSELYNHFIDQLMDKGLVYTDQGEKGEALVFKARSRDLVFHDLIRGKISIDASEITDIVIRKSDGTPTYLFACTVDDIDLGITHIIRGEDHITNTFKQIQLFEALAPESIPLFAHLPLILAEDGSRLSKRHGATSVLEFRKMGFLPEALKNYLMLLGWSPKNNIEQMDFDEACRVFDVEKVVKKGAKFSYEKAAWMNGQYIKNTRAEDLLQGLLFLQMEAMERYVQDDKNKFIRALLLRHYN